MTDKMHTPGPWLIDFDGDGEHVRVMVDDLLPGAAVIAEIEDQPERLANGYLISAAPELYEVVKHAIGILEGLDVDALGEAGTADDSWPLRDEYLHRFRAALAKAEGPMKVGSGKKATKATRALKTRRSASAHPQTPWKPHHPPPTYPYVSR